MNNLGKALEAGAGVAADPVEALKWYFLASARATEDEQMVARNVQNLLNGLQPAADRRGSRKCAQVGRKPAPTMIRTP
jgi:TPR repeat protein